MTDMVGPTVWAEAQGAVGQLAAAPTTGNPVSTFLSKEPVLVSSIVAALGVFSTIRWGASGADLTNQLVAGLLPILIGFVARQFVTPNSKVLTPTNVAGVQSDVAALKSTVDELVHGRVKTVFDSIAAATASAPAYQVATPTIVLQNAPPVAALDVNAAGQTISPPPLATLNEEGDSAGVTPAGW